MIPQALPLPAEQGMAVVIPFDQTKTQTLEELRKENKRLEQRVRDLLSQNRLALQVNQALGDYNRYLASEKLGRPATDNEAFLHYIQSGGKTHFDATHPISG